MTDAPPRQLDYAPAPPLEKQRRLVRRGFLWAGLGLLVVAAVQFGPGLWRQAWYLRGQARCMGFALPAGQVAYANDPADATPLLAAGYKPVASAIGRVLGTAPGATMSAGS